jgi:NitT/TauT family transport system ATP-binding protein
MPERTILEVKNISMGYFKGDSEFKVMDGVSFNVEDWEFVSVIGPSGCGKSSLIRTIIGLQEPTKGKIIFEGKEVNSPPFGMQMIFQNFVLLPWKTALENVELALEESGLNAAEIEAKSTKALANVNLHGFENAYPGELSGGMRQRVGMARAMVSDPDLLLMDEPFSSLDELTAEQLRGEVYRILKDKSLPIKSVIMVSHNVDEVLELSDRIVVLSKPPSHIIDIVKVDIEYPRSQHSPKFEALRERILGYLYKASS